MNPFFFIIPFFFFFIILISIIDTLKVQKKARHLRTKPTVRRAPATMANSQSDHNQSHNSQIDYSIQYSKKNNQAYDIKDKPLSEAEKNVLYGK